MPNSRPPSGLRHAVAFSFSVHSSAAYDHEQLARALHARFADTLVVGCSTAGEITPHGYADGAIVAVGFPRSKFAATATLIKPVSAFAFSGSNRTVAHPLSALHLPEFLAGLEAKAVTLCPIASMTVARSIAAETTMIGVWDCSWRN